MGCHSFLHGVFQTQGSSLGLLHYRQILYAGPLMGACWSLSHIQLFTLLCTVAHLAPLSMGFSRQKYWSAYPFPSPGDLPDPGIELGSPALWVTSLLSELPGKPHWSTAAAAAAAAKSLQSCSTLSDPMDCSPPGSSVLWIFQARVLEWGAIAFSSLVH